MKVGVGAIGVVCVLAVVAHAEPDQAVLAPAFTASPQALLAAAAKVPATDAHVVYLRQDNEVVVDDKGGAVSRYHYIYVVRGQSGIDDWGSVDRDWSPFYQNKPTIRARVIDPSGRVSMLDPALIHDAPTVAESPSVFSDRRHLEAPLPRLQIGAVVEVELVVSDRVPLLAAGTLQRFTYASGVPSESVRLVIRAPAKLKATVVQRLIAAKPRHTITRGVETWWYELGRREPFTDDETSLPSDVVKYPYIGVATGASWTAIARAYRELVDRRISDGPHAIPPALKGPPTLATVNAIVAWLHAQVRYTGIEFGEAAITPWPPAETVRRGFGDCKDKATLLVAMLRAAGIRAELALLSTGPGMDVDPELRGMGDFDHAIVRATVGGRAVWIDATEDLYLAGRLPLRDQGRRALVVADDTRDLVLTPRSIAADTVIREVRTWQLAESGAARVTEVSREGGMFEVENRSWLRDTQLDKVRKELESYAQTEYRGELESYTSTSPTDLTTPFAMTVVAKDAERGWTNRAKIEVALFPADVLEKVPSDLRSFEPKSPARVHEFEIWRPHRYEIENRLIVPPGFMPPAPTPERKQALATMTFVERQRLDGNVFTVTFAFDSGKARLAVKDVVAVQKALDALGKEERRIVIEQESWALADRGRHEEAIAAAEALIKAHPTHSVHYTQLGRAYMVAGAGPAARRAARKAVMLEPNSANAHAFLAWTLRQDSFGGDLGFDHDHAGAIAEYRAAHKLDPKLVYVAKDLAAILEVGPTGRAMGADLSGAIAARADAFALDDDDENALALARVYLRAGKPADAERLLRARASSTNRDAMLVAAVAMQRGAAAAIIEASQAGIGRAKALDGAGGLMIYLRSYDLGRALYDASGTFSPTSPQAVLFRKVARRQPGDRRDPRTAVRAAFVALMDPEQPSTVHWDAATKKEFDGTTSLPSALGAQLRLLGDELWSDLVYSAFDLQVAGGKAGPWLVRLEVFGKKLSLYAALDGGVAKLIASQDRPAGLGRHAQRVAKDLDTVRTLLDWARADAETRPQSPHPILKLWGPGLSRDPRAAAVAAAVLAEDAGAPSVLERCKSPIVDARALCDTGLFQVYFAKQQWTQLEKHAVAVIGRGDAHKARLLRATALIGQRRFDDATKVLDELAAVNPNDVLERDLRVEIALGRGQPDAAVSLLEAEIRRPNPNADTRNNLAWLLLARGTSIPRALVLAQEAANDNKDSATVINTLAAVSAAAGDVQAAVREGRRAMELGRRRTPGASDWLVFGLVAEHLGLRADALAAYKKVAPERASFTLHPTSAHIATTRRARLGAP